MLTEKQVQDQNTVNAEANIIEGHLLRILSLYQGQKVCKISGYGGVVSKLKAEFERYCSDHGYNQQEQPFWLNLHASYTSLMATLRHPASALKVELYLGRFDDSTGVLTHLSDGSTRRTDYTLKEVEEALATAYKLEEQARKLRSSVSVFARR
jgi:hypothetical protein